MKLFLRLVSWGGLTLMLASALMVFWGSLGASAYRACALVGTLAWFSTVPFWMKRRLHQQD